MIGDARITLCNCRNLNKRNWPLSRQRNEVVVELESNTDSYFADCAEANRRRPGPSGIRRAHLRSARDRADLRHTTSATSRFAVLSTSLQRVVPQTRNQSQRLQGQRVDTVLRWFGSRDGELLSHLNNFLDPWTIKRRSVGEGVEDNFDVWIRQSRWRCTRGHPPAYGKKQFDFLDTKQRQLTISIYCATDL
jgi:hypothetical protein